MSAPSDGAIVLTVERPTRKATALELVRWYLPDMIIAVWIGAALGGCLSHWIERPF